MGKEEANALKGIENLHVNVWNKNGEILIAQNLPQQNIDVDVLTNKDVFDRIIAYTKQNNLTTAIRNRRIVSPQGFVVINLLMRNKGTYILNFRYGTLPNAITRGINFGLSLGRDLGFSKQLGQWSFYYYDLITLSSGERKSRIYQKTMIPENTQPLDGRIVEHFTTIQDHLESIGLEDHSNLLFRRLMDIISPTP